MVRRMSRARALVALLASLAVACGASRAGSGDGANAHTAADAGPLAIGPDGGSTQSDGVVVTIPPGAVTQSFTVTITPVAAPAPGAIGQVFDIGPTGTQFELPVRIGLPAESVELAGLSSAEVALCTVVDGGWQALPGHFVDSNAVTVGGTTTHLSPYALVPLAVLIDAGVAADANGGDGVVEGAVDASSPSQDAQGD
jgi:hypothetical protein